MDMIGIDLHKRESQLCTLAVDGSVAEQRIVTSRDRFVAVLWTPRDEGRHIISMRYGHAREKARFEKYLD